MAMLWAAGAIALAVARDRRNGLEAYGLVSASTCGWMLAAAAVAAAGSIASRTVSADLSSILMEAGFMIAITAIALGLIELKGVIDHVGAPSPDKRQPEFR